jgi:hypothetical protein
MDDHSMNDDLRMLYRENWDTFSDAMEKGSSAPLLLSTTKAYREASPRLLFVGQETQGWGHPEDTEDPVDGLMEKYEAFRFGENLRHTPFWRAVHEIREDVNPGSSDASILWSNLGKVDVDENLPPDEVLDPLLQTDILPKEIAITDPDAVVFFTGPTSKYDRLPRRTFDDVVLGKLEPNLHMVSHPDLPERSFRTYHPNFLQQDGQWKRVESISQRIQDS